MKDFNATEKQSIHIQLICKQHFIKKSIPSCNTNKQYGER